MIRLRDKYDSGFKLGYVYRVHGLLGERKGLDLDRKGFWAYVSEGMGYVLLQMKEGILG